MSACKLRLISQYMHSKHSLSNLIQQLEHRKEPENQNGQKNSREMRPILQKGQGMHERAKHIIPNQEQYL